MSAFGVITHARERIEHLLTLGTQVKNTVFAGPASGADAVPTFRALDVADLPASVYGTQAANTLYAGPASGPNAAPAFRTQVVADLPAAVYGTQNANRFYAGPTSGGAAAPAFRAQVVDDLPSAVYGTQTANRVYAGPTSGGAAAPAFRALVAADLPAATGTVTSVALTVPAIMSVAGSPVTTSGTLAVSLATQSANLVWAGPTSGGAATPTFRSLVAADIPAEIPQLGAASLNGGLVQYGNVTTSILSGQRARTGLTINFPDAFPTQPLGVWVTINDASFSASELPVVGQHNVFTGGSSVTIDLYAFTAVAADRTFTVYWLAWGN